MIMANISRPSSPINTPVPTTSVSSPVASSSKLPNLKPSSSSDSFEANKAKTEMKAELPANINQTAPKATWRTSLENKINGGIASVKNLVQGIKTKVMQGYEAGKNLLHEVGTFLGNLGTTLTGLARHNPTEENAAQARTPDQIPLPKSSQSSPTLAPSTPVSAASSSKVDPLDLGAALSAEPKKQN